MKRIFIAIALSLSLSGCITLSELQGGVSLVTKSVTNPVTKDDEAKVELSLNAAVDALRAYKAACAAGTADKNCRANVAEIQAYTRSVPDLMTQLRGFVDNDDRINASVVYNRITALYATVKKIAADRGVSLGSTS